jgi:dTDP-4-dehydrorhamnose 3,5-epimerase
VIVERTGLPDVVVFRPRVHADGRGRFLETWREAAYREAGVTESFVQDNASFSKRHVLRGLHFQFPRAQGKLVTVLHGEAYDVVVDIRRGSPSFGDWIGVTLTAEGAAQVYVPPGFAHGFIALSAEVVFSYKCTEYYDSDADACIRWNDPSIGVEWPVGDPILSEKDAEAPLLSEIAQGDLPTF